MTKKCIVCNTELTGRKLLFCSLKCKNQYHYENDKEKITAYKKEYYQKNYEKCRKKHKEWMENNREKVNAYMRNYKKLQKQKEENANVQ